MTRIVYRGPGQAMDVFSCFHAHVSQHHVHPNVENFLARVPDLPRPRLRTGSRRMNSHRGKRSSLPLSSSRYMLFTASRARIQTHAHTPTNAHASSVLSSIASLCCSFPRPLPSTCLPAPVSCRTRFVDAISGEPCPSTLQFRRTQSTTYLLVDLRLAPICSHSFQTPTNQVARRQPSTLRSLTE